ncbi:hypothetical protein [Marinospirillum perlucidum]|uniref:hypothetical protein n=1 Tax=Marinospirillum perlucidum TaxID=1982602 RepID=UPI000DF47ED9|nr:hypothetical protein [Marinospirillum perlucidum]
MINRILASWLILVRSIFFRIDSLLIFLTMIVVGASLLMVIHSIRFSEVQLIENIKSIYPEVYINSRTEPEVIEADFERHLLALNESLPISDPADTNKKFLMPDLNIRSASPYSLAGGITPQQNEVYVTPPIYQRIYELFGQYRISLMGNRGAPLHLDVNLLPVVTSDRWMVFHPQTVEELRVFGRARMQTWVAVNVNYQSPAWETLQAADTNLKSWVDLLPLKNRLIFSLVQYFSTYAGFFILIATLTFLIVFSRSLVDQIKQWLGFVSYFSAYFHLVALVVSCTFAVSAVIILALAFLFYQFLSGAVLSYLSSELHLMWESSHPSLSIIFLALLSWPVIYLVIYTRWRNNGRGFWER